MPATYFDQDQLDDLRANNAIAQTKQDYQDATAPDRAVDSVRADYYNQRAADSAVDQVRTDYYSQRMALFPAAGAAPATPPEAPAAGASPSPPIPASAPASPSPTAPVTAPLSMGPATRESQFGLGLSSADAMAFCGPTAAIAFAKTYGRNPTVDEAKQLAQSVGWNPNQGMAGVQSEQKLLANLGVQTKLEQGVNWDHVAQDANNGNPVIIDTPGHYFYITGARDGPNGKEFNVGTSGTDLRRGATWMTPGQMAQVEGAPRAALYADHPLAQGSSQAEGNPVTDVLGKAADAVKSKAAQVADAVGTAVQTGLANAGATGSPLDALAAVAQPALQSPLQTMADLNAKYQDASDPLNLKIRDRMTPEDQQQWDNLILAVGGVAGAGGQIPKTGTSMLSAALEDIKTYPQEFQQSVADLVQKAKSIGMADSDIAAQVRRFIQQNPVPETAAGQVPTAPTGSVGAAGNGPVVPEAAAAETPAPATVGAGAPPPADVAGVIQKLQDLRVQVPGGENPRNIPLFGTGPDILPPEKSPNLPSLALSALNETKRSIYALSNVHAGNMTKALLTSPDGGPAPALTFLKDYATSIATRLAGQPDATALAADASPEAAQWMTRAANDGANWLSGANPDVGTQLVGQVAGRVIGGATTGIASGAATYNATQGDPDQGLKTFMAGATGAVLGATLGPAMHDALFKDAMPRAATALYRAAVEGGTPGKEAATYVNNLFGMNNLEKILGSRPMADLARLGLQAPSWLFSEARLAGSAVAGAAKTAVGATPTANQALSRDWWVRTLLTYGAVTEATQFALTGHFTNENSPGSEFMVEVPTGQKAPSGNPANVTFGLFPGQAQQVLDAAARTANSPASGAAETASSRVNRLLVTAYDELANEQYYNFQKWQAGPPIVKPTEKVFGKVKLGDTTEAGLAKRAEFAASQFAPISATGSEREVQYGAPLPLVGASMLFGQPMSANTRTQRAAIPSGAPAPLPGAPTPLPTRGALPRRPVPTPIPGR